MAESGTTRRALADAMKQLMAARPLQSITVGELCGVCHMNRKSFYYHFRDKYDLVIRIFEADYAAYCEGNAADADELLMLCAFFESDKAFYRQALRVEGQNSLREHLTEVLAPIISRRLPAGENRDFYHMLCVHLYQEAIIYWVLEGCRVSASQLLELMYNAGARLDSVAPRH